MDRSPGTKHKILVISNLCVGSDECYISDEKIINIFNAYLDQDYKIVLNGNTFLIETVRCCQNKHRRFGDILRDHGILYLYLIEKIYNEQIIYIVGDKDDILIEYPAFNPQTHYDTRGVHIEFGNPMSLWPTANSYFKYAISLFIAYGYVAVILSHDQLPKMSRVSLKTL